MNTEPEETTVGASNSSDLLGQLPEHSHNFRPRWPGDEGGFTATQMRKYAAQQVTAERDRHADALRCALEALDYCIEDSAELLNERTVQWGSFRKDRLAAMAATLERHRAVAERLRALLRA